MARIRLYLKTGKRLSDGTHPIMLMCSFGGRKEVSTGYSCTIKHWDKKSECVKRGFPNYTMINAGIQKMKNDAILSRNEYERLGEPYTPSMVLRPRVVLNASKNDIKGIIEEYIRERGIRVSTSYNWHYLRNLLVDYGICVVNELTEEKVKSFAKWLKSSKGISDGVIRMLLGKVGAICSFGIDRGLMNGHPFEKWQYTRKYQASSNMLYIHHRTMKFLESYIEDLMTVANGNRWSYRDGVLDELSDRSSSLFSLYFYLLDYLWQGLSPIDLSLVLVKDITVKKIGDNDYWCWDGAREKTGKGVKVRIPKHRKYTELMMGAALYRGCEYLLPFFDKEPDADDDKKKRLLGYILSILRPKLKVHFQCVNEIIVAHNIDYNDDVPLIDMECNYYSARHSYAMSYMLMGGSPIALATLLGRSPNTLGQYIKMLEEEGDLADAVSVLI